MDPCSRSRISIEILMKLNECFEYPLCPFFHQSNAPYIRRQWCVCSGHLLFVTLS